MIGGSVVPTAASACSFPLKEYSDDELTSLARKAFGSADLIIDGEVVSGMAVGQLPDGSMPVAAIKILLVWKGQLSDDIIPVAYFSSCDIFLDTKGQQFRVLLNGNGIFTAGQGINGATASEQR